ncbi:hypothetical protein Tco_0645979 [Tanacetum coccineum]
MEIRVLLKGVRHGEELGGAPLVDPHKLGGAIGYHRSSPGETFSVTHKNRMKKFTVVLPQLEAPKPSRRGDRGFSLLFRFGILDYALAKDYYLCARISLVSSLTPRSDGTILPRSEVQSLVGADSCEGTVFGMSRLSGQLITSSGAVVQYLPWSEGIVFGRSRLSSQLLTSSGAVVQPPPRSDETTFGCYTRWKM